MSKTLFKIFSVVALLFSFQALGGENEFKPELKIQWLGGPSMLITFNNFQILTDPMFGDGKEAFLMGDPNEMFDLAKGPNIIPFTRHTNFPDINIDAIDLVVLSHAHEDHFDQEAEKVLSKNIPMLIPSGNNEQMKAKGFQSLMDINWGETVTYKAGNGFIKFTAVTAHHSANHEIDKILGHGNGYWIEFAQGDWSKTIYWTGDTLPTGDILSEVSQFGKPDILIPHMGRVGTTGPLGKISMGSEDLIMLADTVLPKKILPIHHSTYSLYLEPISEFLIANQSKKHSIDLISEGSQIIYN